MSIMLPPNNVLSQLTFLKHKIVQYHAKGETWKYNSSSSSPTIPLPIYIGSSIHPSIQEKKNLYWHIVKSESFKKDYIDNKDIKLSKYCQSR